MNSAKHAKKITVRVWFEPEMNDLSDLRAPVLASGLKHLTLAGNYVRTTLSETQFFTAELELEKYIFFPHGNSTQVTQIGGPATKDKKMMEQVDADEIEVSHRS